VPGKPSGDLLQVHILPGREQDFPDFAPVLVLFISLDSDLLIKTRSLRLCFDRMPKACFFSGASIPDNRILCCVLEASSTVTVSPSATPTTRPVMVAAWEQAMALASSSAGISLTIMLIFGMSGATNIIRAI